MYPSDIPYTESELLKRVIRNARVERRSFAAPRWVLVKRMFVCGSTVSQAICREYGFDPHEVIEGPPEYDDDEERK